jgi:hypothetical protein
MTRRETAFSETVKLMMRSNSSTSTHNPGSVDAPPHLRLMFTLAPFFVVLQPDKADKGAACLLLHRPQSETALIPMTHEPSHLRLALPTSEHVGKVPQLSGSAHTRA